MGGYASIEELKNDSNIRSIIEKSINTIYEMQNNYHENIREVKYTDVSSSVIGDNTVDSGGGVIIGTGDDGVVITQTTNIQTEMQTMYYANFLSKNTEPIVSLISSEFLNMTDKNNMDEVMPNFYDPVFIMNMIGYNVSEAYFDFDNDVIKYKIDYGEVKEQIDDSNKTEYERMNNEQKQRLEHNEKYKETYNEAQRLNDELNKLISQYKELLQSYESSIELIELQNKLQVAKLNLNKAYTDLSNDYIVQHTLRRMDSDKYFDDTCKRLWKSIKNNKIYVENIDECCLNYIKTSGLPEYQSNFDLMNINNLVQIMYEYIENNHDELINRYSESEVQSLHDLIIEYKNYYKNLSDTIMFNIIKSAMDDYENSTLYSDFDTNQYERLYTLNEIYIYAKNQYNELNIQYDIAYNKFAKENTVFISKAKTLQDNISQIQSELNKPDIIKSLIKYKYYETEPITNELLDKINEDMAYYESLIKTLNEKDDVYKTLRDEVNNLSNKIEFMQLDMNALYVRITNNQAYQNNLKELTEESNNEMKLVEYKITTSKEYKQAYDEYTRDFSDIQKQYVSISDVVNYSKNNKLYELYDEYIKLRNNLNNKLTLDNIANYKNSDNDKDLVESLKNDVAEYNNYDFNYNMYKLKYEDSLLQLKSVDNGEYIEAYDEYQNLKRYYIKFRNILNMYTLFDYNYMTFKQLYEIITSNFVVNIREKIVNIHEKVSNLIENITRSTYNYAQNKISIEGNFNDVYLVQSNEAIQKMYDGFDKIIDEADELLHNDHDDYDDHESNDNTIPKNNRVKLILLYVALSLIVFIIVVIGIKCYMKNKYNRNTSSYNYNRTDIIKSD